MKHLVEEKNQRINQITGLYNREEQKSKAGDDVA